MKQIDTQITYFLNSLAHKNDIVDAFWVFLAQYAIFIIAVYLIYYARKERKYFFKIVIATLAVIITVSIIKHIVFVPRPFLQENVSLLIEHRSDSAFPSKHAAVAFVAAFGIFLDRRKPGKWLLGLAFLIAISRVIVGVHYFSDITAGALIGMSIAAITHKLFLIRSSK